MIATTAVLFVYGDWLFRKYQQFTSLWYLGLYSSSKRIRNHKTMHLTRAHVLCTNKHRPPSEFRTCLLNPLCHGGPFEENSTVSGQHQIQYTEWRLDTYTYNQMYNFTYAYFIYHVNKNILLITEKIIPERNSQPRLGCCHFSTFLHNEQIM
jgi:hypothetical protein